LGRTSWQGSNTTSSSKASATQSSQPSYYGSVPFRAVCHLKSSGVAASYGRARNRRRGGSGGCKPDDRQDNTQVQIRPRYHADSQIEQKECCTRRKVRRLGEMSLEMAHILVESRISITSKGISGQRLVRHQPLLASSSSIGNKHIDTAARSIGDANSSKAVREPNPASSLAILLDYGHHVW
jgi:hypothetical protein